MPYRGPNPVRIGNLIRDVFLHAGYTATWRQYVSASAGIPEVGLGDAYYYREQTITAVFQANPRIPERQTPAGMLAAGEGYLVTREKLARRDELIWRGVTWRVESDPSPAALNGTWVTLVKRGE